MDLLAILLLVFAVSLVASSLVPTGNKALLPGGASLQTVVSVLLTLIFVPLSAWVIFVKANATPFQTQSAAGFLGTCFGYWFKK